MSIYIVVLLFLLAGAVGAFIALRINNIIIQILALFVSFGIPYFLLRSDLLLSALAWAGGAVLVYLLVRGRTLL